MKTLNNDERLEKIPFKFNIIILADKIQLYYYQIK